MVLIEQKKFWGMEKMDEELKEEFRKIWNKIKELEEKNINQPANKETPNSKENLPLSEEIEIFCKNFGMEKNNLKYLIDFQKDYPRLTILPREKIRRKLQLNCLLTLSVIYTKIYRKELSEKEVRELFKISRIPMGRMDKLYSSKNFLRFFSKSGGSIKFTWAGEQEGIKEIKEMIKNETGTSK